MTLNRAVAATIGFGETRSKMVGGWLDSNGSIAASNRRGCFATFVWNDLQVLRNRPGKCRVFGERDQRAHRPRCPSTHNWLVNRFGLSRMDIHEHPLQRGGAMEHQQQQGGKKRKHFPRQSQL